MKIRKIHTIGHSNHSIEYFLEMLQMSEINCLIDVRSIPASSHNPQFNKESLRNFLKRFGIVYMHFGNEFGARHEDEYILDEKGIVNFELFQKTRQFQDGIERVDIGISKGFKISLMCSEGNPLECHRFSMISSYLVKDGIEVNHILRNKEILSHESLVNQLLEKYKKKLPLPSLFEPEVDQKKRIKYAYKLHNKQIGWRAKKHNHLNQEL